MQSGVNFSLKLYFYRHTPATKHVLCKLNLNMKINFYVFCFLFITIHSAKGQDATVEKSIFNIQTGILGAWVNNEARIGDQVVLRTEVGLNLGYYVSYSFGSRYVLAPTVSLEPRWYYNIGRRQEKGKRTEKNSANFLSVEVNYVPDWFVISDIENYSVANQVSIIPKWGLRRAMGNSNFNYEVGAGLGYRHVFFEGRADDSRLAVDVHFRIGYTIK